MVILAYILSHPPSEAVAFNNAVTLEQQVRTINESPHIRTISGVKGVLFLRKMDRAIDCYGNVCDISERLDRHHRESVVSGNQHFSVVLATVRELHSSIEGSSISIFSPDISSISNRTKIKDVVSSKRYGIEQR